MILVMREEFLGRLEPFAHVLPEELRTRYQIEGLREEAAICAVVGPVTKIHGEEAFEANAASELVRRLRTFQAPCAAAEMREVVGEFVEPMHLQLTCQKLWRHVRTDQQGRRSEPRQITLDVVNRHADVAAALQDFYDEAIHETAMDTKVAEWRLREWCGKLITPQDTRGIMLRDSCETGGVPNEAAYELELRHLVRTEDRFGSLWYELTHDRFIEPIKRSNAEFEISSKRRNLEKAAISMIVLALTDLRLTESFAGVTPEAHEPCPRSNEPVNRLAVDPVKMLEEPEVRFFFTRGLGSDVSDEEKYGRLIRLFELQDRLNQKLLENKGPDEDTPEGMHRMVASVAQREGIWKPSQLLERTFRSVQLGVWRIQKCRRDDRSFGYPNEPSQLWATGHALLALCSAYEVLERASEIRQVISEGVEWVVNDLREWFVERFPPPEERSVYEVSLGLICLRTAASIAEGGWSKEAASLIDATLDGLVKAQNEDGGWDAKIWREGHEGFRGVYSEVGATSWALQSLAAWKRKMPALRGPVLEKGINWLTRTQNKNGSWNDGSCGPESVLKLRGKPSVTKTCDAIQGILAEKAFKSKIQDRVEVRRAVGWLRRQERRICPERGADGVGWAWEDHTFGHTHSIATCVTLETLAQVDDISLPLLAANAKWLMDSQDMRPDSATYGSWPHGDTFRSTYSLVEYYKRIKASPFFLVEKEEEQTVAEKQE
jgi:hypothetical protein